MTRIIKLFGLVRDDGFERARHLAQLVAGRLPEIFATPEVHKMFEVEWNEKLMRERRIFGKRFYHLRTNVMIYIDNQFVGDHLDFEKIIQNEFERLNMKKTLTVDGEKILRQFLLEQSLPMVFFTIAIDTVEIGDLIFQLYSNNVPKTIACFMQLCTDVKHGYKNATINRVTKSGWFQIDGRDINTTPYKYPNCENRSKRHDRRGTLSLCHNGSGIQNTTQFFVTFNPSMWMDRYYVAIGHLIMGETTLATIETTPTYYESPLNEIKIINCGVYPNVLPNDESLTNIYQDRDELTTNDNQLEIETSSVEATPSRDVCTNDMIVENAFGSSSTKSDRSYAEHVTYLDVPVFVWNSQSNAGSRSYASYTSEDVHVVLLGENEVEILNNDSLLQSDQRIWNSVKSQNLIAISSECLLTMEKTSKDCQCTCCKVDVDVDVNLGCNCTCCKVEVDQFDELGQACLGTFGNKLEEVDVKNDQFDVVNVQNEIKDKDREHEKIEDGLNVTINGTGESLNQCKANKIWMEDCCDRSCCDCWE